MTGVYTAPMPGRDLGLLKKFRNVQDMGVLFMNTGLSFSFFGVVRTLVFPTMSFPSREWGDTEVLPRTNAAKCF